MSEPPLGSSAEPPFSSGSFKPGHPDELATCPAGATPACPAPARAAATPGLTLACPHCHNRVTLVATGGADANCPVCGSSFRVEDGQGPSTVDLGRRLGHFQLLNPIGQGAFGTV